MSVELEPQELGFRRPFTHEVSQELRLSNPHESTVAFKVKTTAPRQYCVRPNSGTIPPNGEVSIQVLLQAMKEDPPLDARCRDKFLVQSAPASGDSSNVAAIWSEIEKTAKETIKERKIRVTFLPADSGSSPQQSTPAAAAAAVTNGSSEEPPPAYQSPSPVFGSPAQSAATPAGKSAEKSTYEAAASTVASAAAVTKEQLQQQLDAARSQILSLKSAAEQQGLRQRKTEAAAQDSRASAATGSSAGTTLATQQASGVPMQIVAALCLLSFLLAYFFF